MVNTSLLGRRASSQGRITRRVGALALALLGLTCLAVFTRHGWGRTELISSKDGGGVDNIYAETGVKPDAPQKPTVHHPHHAGITARAVTAAEYEAALGKDINGNPFPKQAKATRSAKIAAKDAALENKEERRNEPDNKKVPSSSLSAGALPAGWEKKYDHSKGKYFYINASIKAISWNRPDALIKAAKSDVKDSKKSEPAQSSASPQISSPPRDSRMAADVVQQPHFKSPSARNPIYEGTGNELNQALKYNKVAVASARQYYAKIAQVRAEAYQREQQLKHAVHTNVRKPQRKKSHLTQLGDRAFFKFDPVKGSFFRYSPDKGAVARPGSIADTLSKYEHGEEPSASSMSVQSRAAAQPPTFAQPRPQMGFTEAHVALPNGDIVSARKHPAAMHAKPHFAIKRSIDVATHNTREYKAAAADASSALLNVARTVAMNAGYHPDHASHAHHAHATHAAAHPRSIEAHTDFQGRAMNTHASAVKQAAAASHAPHAPAEGVKAQKSGENKAEGSEANGQDDKGQADKARATAAGDDKDDRGGKDKSAAPAAEESHVRDPDWEARKAMNQASGGYGQRTFYKYDPAKGDFYKFTPDAARNLQPATTFAPEARI